jgi:glycogen synthase
LLNLLAGLGVMVDELTVTLAELGADVVTISPFYHLDRKGKGDYLKADGITYTGRTVTIYVGSERIELGLHSGVVNNVRVMFLHHAEVFPRLGSPPPFSYRARCLPTACCRMFTDRIQALMQVHSCVKSSRSIKRPWKRCVSCT